MGGPAKKVVRAVTDPKNLGLAALGGIGTAVGASLFGKATEPPDLPDPPPEQEAPDVAADTSTAVAERQRLDRRRRRARQTPTVLGGLGVNPTPGVARTVLGGGSGV
ncbi:MAG: hypothetical protein ACR2QF_03070 [Geminicoccaceae bacterium]